MRRDNWTLDNGIKAGDGALYKVGNSLVRCMVIKVRGWAPDGESGNVLIELDGPGAQAGRKWVLGSELVPETNNGTH